jgi:hypothetical protein
MKEELSKRTQAARCSRSDRLAQSRRNTEIDRAVSDRNSSAFLRLCARRIEASGLSLVLGIGFLNSSFLLPPVPSKPEIP